MPKTGITNTFKTKVPDKYHNKIYEWASCGLPVTQILTNLETEFNYTDVSERSLYRLVSYLTEQRKALTKSVFQKNAEKDVVTDFERLANLMNDLDRLAAKATKSGDDNLRLKTADRQIKILQIKFAISAQSANGNAFDQDAALEGLLSKCEIK